MHKYNPSQCFTANAKSFELSDKLITRHYVTMLYTSQCYIRHYAIYVTMLYTSLCYIRHYAIYVVGQRLVEGLQTTSTLSPASNAHNYIRSINCVHVDRPFKKSCWLVLKILLLFPNSYTLF